MIDNTKKVLLVIDLQKQFKDSNGQYEKCLKYIEGNRGDYYIIGTIFQNTQGSMYEKHLDWHDCMNADKSDLEYSADDIIIKNSYSVDVDELFNKLNKSDVHIDIIGCDADACVLATVFALWDKGKDFSVLSGYVYTTAEDFTKDDVLKVMNRNFGNCIK